MTASAAAGLHRPFRLADAPRRAASTLYQESAADGTRGAVRAPGPRGRYTFRAGSRPPTTMGFRDDREAMRARVEALEDELEALRRENATLRRRDGLPGGPATLFFGAPVRLRVERVVDGELHESAHEMLVEEARSRFGALGRVTRVGRSFAWSLGPPASTRILEISAAPRRGRTTIRVQEQLANVAGGLFGGIVGGLGGGGLGVVLPLSFALRLPFGLLPLVALAWVTTVYAVVRASFRGLATRRHAELVACADELAELAVDGDRGAATRVRAPEDRGHDEDRDADIDAPRRRRTR